MGDRDTAGEGAREREEVLGEGRFLRLMRRGKWEYVERTNASDVVGILATTPEGRLLLVEQWREPVRARCVELPAGLVGDVEAGEDPATSAARELEEETGWRAGRVELVTDGVVSAGLTDETVKLYRATDLSRVGEGGGDEQEEIEVHAVPLAEVSAFVRGKVAEGRMVDWKVWAGLWFVGR